MTPFPNQKHHHQSHHHIHCRLTNPLHPLTQCPHKHS
jgi:hypothetical protein